MNRGWALAALITVSFGCDSEPTADPTTASLKLWCQGQEVDPGRLNQIPTAAQEQYLEATGCVWGVAPPAPEPAAEPTSVPLADYKVPVETEVGDGSLALQFSVDIDGVLVPVRFTVDSQTRAHPDYVAAHERSLAAKEALNASNADDPNHTQVVANRIEALAAVRLVMRALGDTDSALGIAVLILGTLTQNLDHLSAVHPAKTSLVATFPDAGTGYCNEITSGISDQITAVRIYSDCTASEINHFLIVEALADKGRWVETDYCVSVSQLRDGIGSYKLLAECLRDKHQAN